MHLGNRAQIGLLSVSHIQHEHGRPLRIRRHHLQNATASATCAGLWAEGQPLR